MTGRSGTGRLLLANVAITLLVIGAGCGAGSGGPARTPSMTAHKSPPPRTPAAPATGGSTGAAQLTLSPSGTAAGPNSSGLQIEDLVTGTGEEARAGDIVYVTYRETLTDGTLVEETVVENTPVPARKVLRQGLIIQGLVEGIPGMKVGGKRRLVIPPALAYGSQSFGSVPPDSTIIFDIDLVEVRHQPGP